MALLNSRIVPMKFSVKGSALLAFREAQRTMAKTVPLATMHALNYAAKKVKTSAKREISSATGVPSRVIGKRIALRKASIRWKKMYSSVGIMVHPVPASVLNPTVNKRRKGVRAGRHFYKGAFIATGNGGHTMVFRRQPAKSYTPQHIPELYDPKDQPRHPIQAMKIDILPQGRPVVRRLVNMEAGNHFRKEFDRQLAWRLKARGAR